MSRRSAVAVGAVLTAVALSDAPNWLIDRLFHPWSRATPPLLDEWTGALTAGNGERLTVVFSLQRARASDGGPACVTCAQIEGEAVTCSAQGSVRRYRVFGRPEDRAGRRLHLNLAAQAVPPPDGLEFDYVSGTWDGADTLLLSAVFFWRQGASAISSSDDPATQPVPLRLGRLASPDRAGYHDTARHCA